MNRVFYRLECFLKERISRRGFLKICIGALLVFLSQNGFLKYAFARSDTSGGRPGKGARGAHDLVLAEGPDPYRNTIEAVKRMGGMERFVNKGDVVVVKPNMAWDRSPEQAANTDPMVVAALVEMCYAAGAKRVNVFDVTCNSEKLCYEHSGIASAAKEKGAYVYFTDHWNVLKARFPYKSPMEGWPVISDAVKCDTFINVPVLKHHGLTGLTLSMKNLMGVCSGKRGMMHVDIGRKLSDLTDLIKPDLTVIDATRVLTRHGPSGGNLEDVTRMDKVIVSADPVLADAFACSLVSRDPMTISYIHSAVSMGRGNADITSADVVRIRT